MQACTWIETLRNLLRHQYRALAFQSETLHPRTAPGAPGSARSTTSEVARDSVCTKVVQEITPAISNSRPAKSCSPIAGKIGPFNTFARPRLARTRRGTHPDGLKANALLIRLSETGADRRWLIERGCGYLIGWKRELTPLHRSSEQDGRAAQISPPCGATFHYAATRDAAARRARGA
jgi:hypothetical protein